MDNSKNNDLKRDLVLIPLIVYFVSYTLYLFLNNFFELKEYALLIKPIIIPSIAFLYLTGRKSKRSILNLVLFVFIFIADNITLLEDESLYIYATMLYMGALYILLSYALLDIKGIKKNSLFSRYIGLSLLLFIFLVLFYWVFFYNHAEKESQIFIVTNYLIVFVVTLILDMQTKSGV